ncbi:Glioma tumor suppressor candidate region gene 2 protein [Liparis tanakae]|uniref:Ribosome biogenesis protein NOP53 n=1 Tax=Liparis tanakae TaxID=230148 RepID=A0A4Z2FCQ0_9TELE|nr:Glioma tumor suppressor candidate region gene 2 protein [Liparis tanakae]
MAPNRRLKRVVASQPGFLKIKSSKGADGSDGPRKKRLNKNKKKSWNKYSDINDVDEFLQDIRHQERTTGGLLSEKSDESLFFLDVRPKTPQLAAVEPVEEKTGRRKTARPLRIDLILQLDSKVLPPKDVLAYQRPNAKKLRRIAQKGEKLKGKGVVTRRQKRLMVRPKLDDTAKKAALEPNNNPQRDYYDIWRQESTSTADPWFLEQTGKMRVKRPDRLNEKPSVLPAVEVIAAGGSYNPDFFSHQALLQVAHEVEVKKQKEADKLVKRLAVKKENFATEETIMTEQVEGLVEEDDEENANEEEEEDESAGGIVVAVKKTEKQRRKERAEILKAQRRRAQRVKSDNQQQLFQLRSIKTSIKQQEADTKTKQTQRKSNQEAQKSQPRRLGKLKFEPQDMEVQLSDELAGSLRQLKPEGSVLKDRFKSLQKRNLIEPRDRAKFKRRLKVKYQEKRAFRAIT